MSVTSYVGQLEPVGFELSGDVIETVARLRPEAVRLHPAPHTKGPVEAWTPALVIDLQVYGRGFHINLTYSKPVFDHLSRLDFMAATWPTGYIGQHAGNPDFVMRVLDRILNEFVTEYLQVNNETCEDKQESRSIGGTEITASENARCKSHAGNARELGNLLTT